MREFRELFRMSGGFSRFVILTIFRCPFDALHTMFLATFLRFAFDAMSQQNLQRLYLTCALSGVGSCLLFLYNGTVWTMYATYVVKWVGAIRGRVFEHISGLSLRQVEFRPSGEWSTRLNADVQAATAMLNQAIHLPHAVVATVNIIVSSIMLATQSPAIYALCVLFVVPHMAINQFLIARPMTGLSLDVQRAKAANTTDLGALITCADTAILYDAQNFLLSRFEQSSFALRRANMKVRHRSATGSTFMPLLGMSGYLLILLIGGAKIADGKMTFGDLTAAFQYRGGLIAGSAMFMNSVINIKIALAGVKRVTETMKLPREE